MSKKYYMPDLDYDWFGEKPTGNYYVRRGNLAEVHSMPGRDINWEEVKQLFDAEIGRRDEFISLFLDDNCDDDMGW